MEIIKIPVSYELAQQLRSYKNELPRLLELGLRVIKTKKITSPVSSPTLLRQKRVIKALRQAGAIGPDAETIAQYLAKPEVKKRQPIRAGGKPTSTLIIEERNSRSWD
ncbi:MAG: hypothetical protein KAI83_17750 [Thiomargarita sp.]|nr:hypothetical protein [Thiomargarita sp.]